MTMESEMNATVETEQSTATAATDAADLAGFEWCVCEIFGHRSHAGRSREEERFGSKMMRIDALRIAADGSDIWQTFYYSGGSLFSYQPSTEETVRARAPREYAPRRAAALPAPELDDDFDGDEADGVSDDRDYEHG